VFDISQVYLKEKQYVICSGGINLNMSCEEKTKKTLWSGGGNNLNKIRRQKKNDLVAKIYFSFDSDGIKGDNIEILEEVVGLYKNNKIKIYGFTDSIGSERYNHFLSIKRSDAVKKYLISRGLNSRNLVSEGRGGCCYIGENSDAKGREVNRRVEIYAVD